MTEFRTKTTIIHVDVTTTLLAGIALLLIGYVLSRPPRKPSLKSILSPYTNFPYPCSQQPGQSKDSDEIIKEHQHDVASHHQVARQPEGREEVAEPLRWGASGGRGHRARRGQCARAARRDLQLAADLQAGRPHDEAGLLDH